jgi:glycosyltransferase involved in cell wall biosynthesis
MVTVITPQPMNEKPMNILLLYDNSLSFFDIHEKAIAGTQTAFYDLSRAFLQLGCNVIVLTKTNRAYTEFNYKWENFEYDIKGKHFDLMIVNVSPRILYDFRHVKSSQRVLWVHNEAKYLLYYARLKYIVRFLPKIVFSGSYHRSTLPFFIPTGGRFVIPFGLNQEVFKADLNDTRRNLRVYFTSNPMRSLRWLVDIWETHIHPNVPAAELHVFSGWQTYGAWGIQVKKRMQQEIDYANSKQQSNVYVRDVIPKNELFIEMKNGRAMFYKGDKAETFCLAIAEAQALGLPAVVCNLGSLKERVIHNKTGFIAQNDNEFIDYALKVLKDDQLWQSFKHNAIAEGKELTWRKSAKAFLELCSRK